MKEEYMKEETMSYVRDWKKALRTPHVYRVANRTFRVQNHIIALTFLVMSLPLTYFILPWLCNFMCTPSNEQSIAQCQYYKYNRTYPLSSPIKTNERVIYKIAMITDPDHGSKSLTKKNTWHSTMRYGALSWNRNTQDISITWDDNTSTLSTTLAMNDRGMELSELVTFDGRLLTFDDRTGIVYFIEGDQAYPWLILMDGNGKNVKGFKSEWATVKDELLYVGSMGKEWTTSTGEFRHNNPQWVKVITPRGEVHSLNWMSNFKRLRRAIDIEYPGYMIHECGTWSDVHKRWFFLPRRCSQNRYDEKTDEMNSCNVLLIADENFNDIKVTKIGTLIPIRGYSSFKFIPDSNDSIIVALKTEEFEGHLATYVTVFTIDGTILLPDSKVANEKFEGIEFI